jgi:hypothetical protein
MPQAKSTEPPLPPMSCKVIEVSSSHTNTVYVFFGNFWTGAVNGSPPSNMNGPSTATTTGGILMGLTELASEREAKMAAKWATKLAAAEGSAKIAKVAGRVLGVAGTVITALESYQDGHFSAGDYAKIGIGILTTACPIGWVYGVADLAVGIVTGKSITDRIGDGVQAAFDN